MQEFTSNETCNDCRKYDGGCWIFSNLGEYYTKHKPHHKCFQFVPFREADIKKKKGKEK